MTRPEEAERLKAAAIVACGGIGARFCGSPDGLADAGAKQFLDLAGRPVLAHTLAIFERHPGIGFVVLVLPEQLLDKGEALVGGLWPEQGATLFTKVKAIVAGGGSRQESVAKGLAALAGSGWEGPVLVHDGVRPCTPDQVIDRVISGVLTNGNAVAAIPLRDTLKRADADNSVRETVDRRDLWQIQTPQGFRMKDIVEAYEEGGRRGLQVTDDAALLEAIGRQVYLVEGHPANIKITYPEDMALAEAVLTRGRSPSPDAGLGNQQMMDVAIPRMGFGYDAHQLKEGIPLMLGGIEAPWPKGLLGYSDGDVMLHAIMDALLGAACLGDIGAHFPTNDPRYKGISSLLLLSMVRDKLDEAGFAVNNIDCTLVAQRPKVAPYIPAMADCISRTLGIAAGQVSVKATTTDFMGFAGREEGMACYAVCTLRPHFYTERRPCT